MLFATVSSEPVLASTSSSVSGQMGKKLHNFYFSSRLKDNNEIGKMSEKANMCLETENTKKKRGNILLEVLKDYCSSTTIHGIGYIAAEDKTLIEKIWWLIVFLISVVGCSLLISDTWRKWNDTPVILCFDQEQAFISEVPFPAVTICPIAKLQYKYNYTQHFRNRQNLTGNDYKKFWDISLICNLEQYHISGRNVSKTTDEDVIENIKLVAELRSNIQHIRWKNLNISPYNDLFARVITEDGVCYTFNSLSQSDMYTNALSSNVTFISHDNLNEGWTVENGYPSNVSLDTYPRRTAQDGLLSGLSLLLLTLESQTDHVCGIPISGYKVILHNPAEMPRTNKQYLLVPIEKQMTAVINPELIKSAPGLLNISPSTRKCYFSYEKSLAFFKIYTQNNCKIECLANVTVHHCGCVPFHMPRNGSTPICAFGSSFCMKEVQATILQYEMLQRENKITDAEIKSSQYQVFAKCDCLPPCSSLQYRAETSQTDTHYIRNAIAAGMISQAEIDENPARYFSSDLKTTQIDIFFKDTQFLAMQRSELFGRADFLANCGGLLGLFMGFSFLSLLEIVYFFTIRVWFKAKNRRKAKITSVDTKL